MKSKRTITLVQRPCADSYKVKQVRNTTAYSVGQNLKKKDVEYMITNGFEVVIN